jgi:hypothetical protein
VSINIIEDTRAVKRAVKAPIVSAKVKGNKEPNIFDISSNNNEDIPAILPLV